MAVTDSSKIDLLYKKLFGVSKSDTSTNKGASNEAISSPSLLRGDTIWLQSNQIPSTAAAVATIVQSYNSTNKIQCTADTTSATLSSIYPTWKTGLTDWISPEFGATYFVKAYFGAAGLSDPAVSGGTQFFDSGTGGTGEWWFDYQAGTLNFIGGTNPTGMTSSHVVYIMGYRYIGTKGIQNISSGGTTYTAGNGIDISGTVLSINSSIVAPLASPTFTGTVTLPGAPTSDLQAATKLYVDNITSGINFHQPVRVATTANITLSGTQTVDGVALLVGDRILVKDQTDAKTNGIYVVASSSWSRSADADNNPTGELAGGDFCLVLEGTIGSGYGYVCSNTSSITIGTTNITYVPFNAAKAVVAGSGLLELTPGTLSADTSIIAPLASPALTGIPTAPTASSGTNTTQIATTAYVKTEISSSVQPGAVYQPAAPSSPAIGQIWVDSDEDVIDFDFSPISISSNTTLVNKKRYFVTSSSALTLTLPASPALNNEIQILDASGNASTYNITVARNSSLINGNAGNLIIDVNGGWYTLLYTGATYGWKVK